MKNLILSALLSFVSFVGFSQTITITNDTDPPEDLTVGLQFGTQGAGDCTITISEDNTILPGDSWVYTIPPGPNYLIRIGASGTSGSGFVTTYAPCGPSVPGPYTFTPSMSGFVIE
jgi:hypothetical protein